MFSFMKKKKKEELHEVKAIVNGKTIPMEEVPDKVFASKAMGDGIAFLPETEIVKAPYDGEITMVMKDSKHALSIKHDTGVEMLIHIGIDTVSMNGNGFELLVDQGQKVKAGDDLIRFSKQAIKEAGFPDMIMLILVDPGEHEDIVMHKNQDVTVGDVVIQLN